MRGPAVTDWSAHPESPAGAIASEHMAQRRCESGGPAREVRCRSPAGARCGATLNEPRASVARVIGKCLRTTRRRSYPPAPERGAEMRKISLLLGIVGGAALVSVAAVQGVAASTGPSPATMLKLHPMAPVTGPYVGPANPVRGVPGGGLPWMLTAGDGARKRDGYPLGEVRGAVI